MNYNDLSWHRYFIEMARHVSAKSKDPSTKVGAVVVGPDNEILSTGFNGFPRGVFEDDVRVCEGCGGKGSLYHNAIDDPDMCIPCGGSGKIDKYSERWKRPEKYLFIEHAERNAIYNAARIGVSLKGATLYINFKPCPCNECAKAIIQSGITRIVGPAVKFPGKGKQWEESMHVSRTMLAEAGVSQLAIDADPMDNV